MTSVLARLGHFEARTGTYPTFALWNSETRKRGGWTCTACWRQQGASKRQRREYGVDGNGKKASPAPDNYSYRDTSRREIARSPFLTKQPESEHKKEELWEQFEAVDEADEGGHELLKTSHSLPKSAEQAAVIHTPFHEARDQSLLDFDYAGTLDGAIERQEADLTLRCLFAATAANDWSFLRGISEETFTEILRLLRPHNLAGDLATTHLELSDTMAKLLGIPHITHVATDCSELLKEVIGIREASGWKLTLQDYALLLSSARDLGNKSQALHLWNKLISDGHTPTTECWNYYMSTVVWTGLDKISTRQRFRVTPFSMLARSQRRLGAPYSNYRVGGDDGIKVVTTSIFRSMLANGAIADEASYCTIIVAAAREGDLATVKSIFLKVWNIDVDAIVAGTDENQILPKPYPPSAVVRPTTRLLFTVAHCWGSNNDISTALRLVDFIARHYELGISEDTWSQLFDWTFVLAFRRHGRQARKHGTNTGQIPIDSVQSVWDTMTSAPYKIRPTMIMYNRLIKNLVQRKRTWQILTRMSEAHKLLLKSRKTSLTARDDLHAAIERDNHNRNRDRDRDDCDTRPPPPLEHLRARWEHRTLLHTRNIFWFRRWLRLLLYSTQDAARRDYDGDFVTRALPRQLWIWRRHVPHVVRYGTANGIVEIVFRNSGEIEERAERRRGIMDAEDAVRERAKRYVGEEWMAGRRLPAVEEDEEESGRGDEQERKGEGQG
ncbi:hypothetical protein MBLNU230_g0330t1 [Neophaeotheca triangularis]